MTQQKTLNFKKFFVTSGKGLSNTSKLNAFDQALVNARIHQCNLVSVSSILPPKATHIKHAQIPAGTITFCVLARKDCTEGETISAGIAWTTCETKNSENYGIVAEDTGNTSNQQKIEKNLTNKLKEMAKARKMKIKKIKTKITTIKKIPPKKYGTTIAALVYTN